MINIALIFLHLHIYYAYGGLILNIDQIEKTWSDTEAGYLLWTRSNVDDNDSFSLQMSNKSIEDSNLNINDSTYILYHGYGSEGKDYWILDFKNEILEIEEANIISVDYGHLVPATDYGKAVYNGYKVANQTAKFIEWMSDEIGLNHTKIHLIGYSLGAQVAGMTGAHITGSKLDRITGLDPAGPLFYTASADRRLDKKHAIFVDIIHTNAGSLNEKCYGLFAAIGHVDFYPNGGKHQPGCNAETDLEIDCSHSRAPALFIESVRYRIEKPFYSWPCSDWETFDSGLCNDCGTGCQNMGMNAKRDLEGSFYLRSNSNPPFSMTDDQ